MADHLAEGTAFDPFEHGPQGLGSLPPQPPVDAHFAATTSEVLTEPDPRVTHWRALGYHAISNRQPSFGGTVGGCGKSGRPAGMEVPLMQAPLPYPHG